VLELGTAIIVSTRRLNLSRLGAYAQTIVWERPNFYSSPSISRSLDAAIAVSSVHREDIDLYDFYSSVFLSSSVNPTESRTDVEIFRCFPIVPKLASHHLGISIAEPSRPVTLIGGLTFFGGAGNNYSMHVSQPHKLLSQTSTHLLQPTSLLQKWSAPSASARGEPASSSQMVAS
jgi:hypothetical protein